MIRDTTEKLFVEVRSGKQIKLDIRSVERGICPIAALYLLRFALVSYDCFTTNVGLQQQHQP